MFVPSVRWITKSCSRTVACLLVFAAAGVLLYFWTEFCVWRADTSLRERMLDRAVAWGVRSQWFGNASDPQVCLVQLRIARRQQDFRRVEELLQQAVILKVPYSEIRRERLLAMVQTNQFSKMEGQWSELLNDPRDDGPEIARAYYTWAMLHHYPRLAEQTLDLWHEDYPEDAEPFYLKGCFYQAQENWEGAEKNFKEAYSLKSDNNVYRLALANAMQNRLNPAAAIPLYEESLRVNQNDVSALQGLAQCEATNGNLKNAVLIARRAVELSPDDFKTQQVYGELLLAAGDSEAAARVLEKAYSAVPEHANLANSLAKALKGCGRNSEADLLFAFVAEARPYLDKLLNLESKLQQDPQNLQLRMEIASITSRYVSRRDAIRWYENLLLIVPKYHPADAALVELYRAVGDEKRAEMHLSNLGQQAVAAKPSPSSGVTTGPPALTGSDSK